MLGFLLDSIFTDLDLKYAWIPGQYIYRFRSNIYLDFWAVIYRFRSILGFLGSIITDLDLKYAWISGQHIYRFRSKIYLEIWAVIYRFISKIYLDSRAVYLQI